MILVTQLMSQVLFKMIAVAFQQEKEYPTESSSKLLIQPKSTNPILVRISLNKKKFKLIRKRTYMIKSHKIFNRHLDILS